jgi:hypothetical protein
MLVRSHPGQLLTPIQNGVRLLGVTCYGHPESKLACGRIARQNGAYYAVIMRTISVKLPDELLAQLTREAKARRVTKSWLVRKSLEKGLYEQPSAGTVSCYDLARDLAGTVKGLPKDLADNPKYMEGFGQ